MRCLTILNPSYWCFTGADFENLLLQIDRQMQQLNQTPPSPLFREKADAEELAALEKTFAAAVHCWACAGSRKPDRQLAYLLGEILGRYGQLCSKKSAHAAKQILLASLHFYLYFFGISNECVQISHYASLEDLRIRSCADETLFASTEEDILKMNLKSCVGQAYSSTFASSYPDRRLLRLSETVRGLGYAAQQLDQQADSSVLNEQLFPHLFAIAEALLLLVDNQESKRELADLYYHAWPLMYRRQNPDDLEGICNVYSQALACDPSPEMKIKVANMQFLLFFGAGQKKRALPYIEEALALSSKLTDSHQHRFLKAFVNNNYAGYLMELEDMDLKNAEKHLLLALDYAQECRQSGEDHLYFAIYDMRLAEIKCLCKDFQAAKEAVLRAFASLERYPEYQTHSYRPKAEKLYTLIEKELEPCSPTTSS